MLAWSTIRSTPAAACHSACWQVTAGAATIILDGVRSGAWRILVGQDAINLDAAVRAKPEDAYDYPALASMATQNAGDGSQETQVRRPEAG